RSVRERLAGKDEGVDDIGAPSIQNMLKPARRISAPPGRTATEQTIDTCAAPSRAGYIGERNAATPVLLRFGVDAGVELYELIRRPTVEQGSERDAEAATLRKGASAHDER